MGVFLLTKAVKENKIFPIDDCESRKSTSLIDLGNNSDSYKMLISILQKKRANLNMLRMRTHRHNYSHH
ncbi:hypothetical protein EB796_021955 [Bugula neritina]|uniref:Uncharacterized protein n=1 Tax=Bugula neritina TaxID=10212 RepID=A0A7J7J1L9_BUGNE|nr:hypothetical protein EB796_021955 [Bugula neritina]